MITFWTGLPGSGKTYASVDFLYSVFCDSKSKNYAKFKLFYTNINGFDFTKFDANVGYSLNFDDLLIHLCTLHNMATVQKLDDHALLDYCRDNLLIDAVFVIDECHNFFDIDDKILVWWLSYHRHLHQDIFLITQNLELVHKKYYSFSEFFYRAKPASLRFFKSSFFYDLYTSHKFYQKSKVETKKLLFNPKVYELYHSGANSQPKNVFYKFLIIAVIFVVFTIFVFKFFISHFAHIDSDDENITEVNTTTSSTNTTLNHTNRDVNSTVISSRMSCYCAGETCSCGDRYILLNEVKSMNIISVSVFPNFTIYEVCK